MASIVIATCKIFISPVIPLITAKQADQDMNSLIFSLFDSGEEMVAGEKEGLKVVFDINF
jgi:hypothetical protein